VIGSIEKNEHLTTQKVLVFPIDPIAQRRFATPVESRTGLHS